MEGVVVFSLIAVFLGLASLAPAVADDVTQEQHCVVFIVGQKADGEFIASEPACFAWTREAEAWVRIGVPWVKASSDLGYDFAPTFVLGQHFDGFNGSGDSVSVVGGSCTGGHWNTSSAWHNRISSSYNGCARLRHWDLPNKSGDEQSTTGVGTTKNLTHMNNRAESVSYHSS